MSNIRNKITKLLYNMPYKLKNVIIFESNPDYCDNTRGLNDRLIELGYNEKMKLVWFVHNKEKFSDLKIKNVIFVGDNEKYKRKYYHHFAKYIIDCNKYIYKLNKNQVRIYLTHGAPIKNATNYCSQCGEVDYLIDISDYFNNITSTTFNVLKEKIIVTGYPRNDILLNKHNNQIFFPEIERKKTICWFPTYRNHKDHSSGKNKLPYGIPSVTSMEDLSKLDNYLQKKAVLLVIKLHPAEDTSVIKTVNFTNIKLIDDALFDIDHSTLYHYLSNVDALITDYSSLYYDFLLTDKPIGLAISDIDEYLKTTGIIFDNYEDNVIGEYIYTFDDLLKFIYHVSNDIDIKYDDRMKMKKIYHKYFDNKSSDRIIKLMEKKNE